MGLAASGDTWGVSGPTFLVVYGVVIALVLTAAVLTRRAIASGGGTAKRPGLSLADLAGRPHDVAYLNGGADLAVFSALSSMRMRELVELTRGSVRSVGRLEPGADDLVRALHFATSGSSVARARLTLHGPVRTALAASEKRLVGMGLLLSERQRRQIRLTGLWMLAVGVLGLVRLLAGIAESKPVGFLLVALLVVVGAALVLLCTAPRRTRAGDRALADLRSRHDSLSPSAKPDWTLYGPAGAALGIGIFGTAALWASDPVLATELAVRPLAAGGAAGGSSFSGDSGGDGGGGGGGGCGGGGGGCGG